MCTIDGGSVVRSGPEPGILLAADSTIIQGNDAQNYTSTVWVCCPGPEI